MSYFLDPTGRSTYGIGICDRCKRVFSIEDLHPDPNSPGLRVCLADLDDFDPYRLPARQTERINLPFVRPDEPIGGFAPPFVLPGFIITEGGEYILSEDGVFIEPEGESSLQTQSLLDLSTEGGDPMIVEPWS